MSMTKLSWVSALLISISSSVSAIPLFDSGIPAGWNCTGNCGTAGADGVVTLAPSGGSQYGWVSTNGGISDVGPFGGTDGSVLRSGLFAAVAGDNLQFSFNYVTSDGGGYADYAWARLLDNTMTEVAMLFTARTKPVGSIVPGQDMPLPTATLTPTDVPIIPGGPLWSVLGEDSGKCYLGPTQGCGYTDWIQSDYEILAAGNYFLEFGVANWTDTLYDSGLAFDGVTVGGKPIDEVTVPDGTVPEPATLALMGFGLAGLGFARRKKA